MTTDKELLELAAKAAGIEIYTQVGNTILYKIGKYLGHWNPLTSNDDALRLAVKLKIPLQFPDWTNVTRTWGSKSNLDAFDEPHGADPYAATRRAIVRCAAEIGKAA